MSLYISLRIGPSPVDTIRVSRITNTDEPILDPDTVSTYQVDRGIPWGVVGLAGLGGDAPHLREATLPGTVGDDAGVVVRVLRRRGFLHQGVQVRCRDTAHGAGFSDRDVHTDRVDRAGGRVELGCRPVSGVVQDMIAPRPTEGWFGQSTGLLDDVAIPPEDARKARSFIRRLFVVEAAFLFQQLGIEEPS